MKIGRLTISDRASAGVYADQSGPAIEEALRAAFDSHRSPGSHDSQGSCEFVARIVPDELAEIANDLRDLADNARCDLIVTTGGTGVSPRDVTPEATRSILEKELPGFGEAMRMHSMAKVKTAILSRATAGTRGQSLIVNLPGKPSAVRECLEILGPAISEAVAHLQGRDPHRQSNNAS